MRSGKNTFPAARKRQPVRFIFLLALIALASMLHILLAWLPAFLRFAGYAPWLGVIAVVLLGVAGGQAWRTYGQAWRSQQQSAAENARLRREKDDQQRFYANLIHEVIKGDAQSALAEVPAGDALRERLIDLVKTCELGQTFVDTANNDVFELMRSVQFIFSNRLHSEMQKRYFYCEIDPALQGVELARGQKYELIFFLRECLNNIRKYAEYRHVGLRMARDGASIVLEIRDDGIGLPATLDVEQPEIVLDAANIDGFSRQYLRDRRCTGIAEIFRKAQRMRGHLSIRSRRGQGTEVELRFLPD